MNTGSARKWARRWVDQRPPTPMGRTQRRAVRFTLAWLICWASGVVSKPVLTLLASIYRPKSDREDLLRSYLQDLRSQRGLDRFEIIFLSLQPLDTDLMELQEAVRNSRQYRHIFFPKDPGLYGMWNAGWRRARGKYVSNLNLDDRLSHGALLAKIKYLRDRPSCAVLSSGIVVSDSPMESFGKAIGKSRQLTVSGPRRPSPSYQVWFAHGVPPRLNPADFIVYDERYRGSPHFNVTHVVSTFNPPHNSPVWRRDLLESLQGLGFDESVDPVSDYELWLRASCSGLAVCHMPRTLQTYYIDPNSHNRRSGKQKTKTLLKAVLQRHAPCFTKDHAARRGRSLLAHRGGGALAPSGNSTLRFSAPGSHGLSDD